MIVRIFKIIFSAVLLLLFLYFIQSYVIPKLEEEDEKDRGLVIKVYDGDTYQVQINGRIEKVRALGIDTPERYESDKLFMDRERTGSDINTIMKLGELSSSYAESLLTNREVILVKDYRSDDRDSHGRLLRFIYLDDGTFVNMKIIEDGYATAYRRIRNSKTDEFIRAENSARENRRGLWGELEGKKVLELQK
ncbi:MAG: thermonuclease family protein [Ignavibacteria bacterium]|nr:thermonuclease family protein [Ignavibacteria bacterium]